MEWVRGVMHFGVPPPASFTASWCHTCGRRFERRPLSRATLCGDCVRTERSDVVAALVEMARSLGGDE